MDKKYTSLENKIRNVVRGNTGAAQDNRSLESKIRSVVLKEEVGLEEARRKSAASLGFISTNAGHGVTASSEPYGDSHLPVVTTSSGKRVDVGHKLYPTQQLAQQGAQTFIDNTYTKQGVDPIRGFKALELHHGENAKKKTNEEVELDEGSAKFAKIMARTAAARGEPITTDTTELEKKHNELLQNSRDAAARAKKAREDYENLARQYGITPTPIGEEFQLTEALGTGGNEGGEFKGTPPAFFKSVHIEPKVGDAHPPAKGSVAASRDRAKISGSETMKKENYIITPKGRVPLKEAPVPGGAALVEPFVRGAIESGIGAIERVIGGAAKPKPKPKPVTPFEPNKPFVPEKPANDPFPTFEPNKPFVPEKPANDPFPWLPDIKPAPKPKPPAPKPVTPPFPEPVPEPKVLPEPKEKPLREPFSPPETFPKEEPKVSPAQSPEPINQERLGVPKQETSIEPNPKNKPKEKSKGKVEEKGKLRFRLSLAAPGPVRLSGGESSGRIDLSKHRHYAQARRVYGSEIHYNEYKPELDYIGENSAEQADAERMSIQNVGRPNSKNKLAKQGEIQRKIIDENTRRKEVILRAKEENKNGKDGANVMVNTKPELKHVHVHEAGGVASVIGPKAVTGTNVLSGGLIGGLSGLIRGDEKQRKKPDGTIDYSGGSLADHLKSGAKGAVQGALDYTLPGIDDTVSSFKKGNYGDAATKAATSAATGYVSGALANMGYKAAGALGLLAPAAIAAGILPFTSSSTAQPWQDEINQETGAPYKSQAEYDALQRKSSTPKSNPVTPTPAPPKSTPAAANKTGQIGGKEAGKAINATTTPAPKPTPKPNLKLPDTKTPGYRTDTQMNDYEAKRAELLKKYTNSAGAQSAGNRSVEAATKSLNTNAPQPSSEINSTNVETPRSMGSSWNNSYKNKYSMGPGPSQFPSK